MKVKKVIILISLIFFSSFMVNIIPARAIIRDQTISTVAEKDSYVSSYYPTSNYGGASWLIFGKYILGWREAYLFFNFSDKPTSWNSAEISIDMYSVSETFNVTVSLINDTWDEYTINWINKPVHREVITTFTVAQGNIYKINITDYIDGRNNISICLNASDYLQTGYVQGSSREGAYFSEDSPQLIWTYPENVEINITSPISTDEWFELNDYTIRWNSTGSIDRVKIELFKGASFVEDITATYTENDGEYDFHVYSYKNYSGTDYQIKITDYDDTSVYAYSDYFSINNWSGTLTITSPIVTDILFELSIHTVRWTSTGSIRDVKIELYKGSSFVEDITLIGYTNNDGEEDFYVSILNDYKGTNYRIKITNNDNSSQYDWSDYFSINIGSGTITVTSPTSISLWQVETTKSITWISTGTIISVDVEIYKGGILKYYSYDVSDIGLLLWPIPEDVEVGTDWRIKISNPDDSAQYDWSEYFEIFSPSVAGPTVPGYNFFIFLVMSVFSIMLIGMRFKKFKE